MRRHGGADGIGGWGPPARPAGRRRRAILALTAAAAVWLAGCDHAASTLATNGTTGAREAALGWFLLAVSSVVVLVVIVLVLVAALRRRTALPAPADPRVVIPLDAAREAAENRWLTGLGVVVPLIILTVAFLFTVVTINAVGAPAGPYAGTFAITGHQWWWEVTYQDSAHPDRSFTTANEIHVPVGQPIQLQLLTADVIHSFWVPQLAGKMDLIPGQHNTLWLEARTSGVYSGPCGEYCGNQHAQMRIAVVAESPEQYQAWLASQVKSAPPPVDPAPTEGRRAFMETGCGTCHTIRGTEAGGAVGPDLTHLASRRTLAAGALPNTAGNLMGWIADAQGIKPGCDMPRMVMAPRALQALVAYLETLQ